jgi:hypothetical protein
MMDMHLAELNVGRLVAPLGDPRVAEFMAALARVNGLAERMADSSHSGTPRYGISAPITPMLPLAAQAGKGAGQ